MYAGTPKNEIETFYFNMPTQPLFGGYHAPQSGPTRSCGVVLCYPMGHEYMQCHRAYRQLGIRLSKAGFPVLRFDFYGCGDSGGDYEEGSFQQWTDDISNAIEELRRRAGSIKICLVGLRLGGTLSMMYSAERSDVDALVLWDVVVNGKAYIDELVDFEKEKFQLLGTHPKKRSNGNLYLSSPDSTTPAELLGFPLTEQLFAELNRINLLTISKKPANHILLIDSNEKASDQRLRAHLKSMDSQLVYRHLPSPQIWIEDIDKVMIPNEVLQSVTSWISEVYV